MRLNTNWILAAALTLGLGCHSAPEAASPCQAAAPEVSAAPEPSAAPAPAPAPVAPAVAASASAKNRCLLVGAPPGTENAEYDAVLIPLLQSWGYVVDKKHHPADVAKYTAADFARYDFIFLSETTASDEASVLKSVPLPMVNSDGWTAKEASMTFGLGKPVGILEPATPVVFFKEAEGHPLAGGHTAAQPVELCKVEQEKDQCLLVWGKPSIPVTAIAGVVADPTQLLAYGIEKGTANASGQVIGNRMAMVGVHAFGYDDLTDSGVKLFKSAIDWVLAQQ